MLLKDFMLLNPHSLDSLLALIKKVYCSPAETELLVAGADHGISREGISRYAFGQTFSVLKLSASVHSPVSRICQKMGIKRSFFNVGCAEKRSHETINDSFYFGAGTKHIAEDCAMDKPTLFSLLEHAEKYVNKTAAKQFCLGEVGVGNTLASTAILALISNRGVRGITGNGSGIQSDVKEKKISLIERALERHMSQIKTLSPIDVLSSLGGFEIAWNVGVILAAHKHNKIVLIDGFITGVSALIAFHISKDVVKNLVATHLSREPGHQYLLDIIGLKPFLSLNMALGQGFGATLGFSFIVNTAALLKS